MTRAPIMLQGEPETAATPIALDDRQITISSHRPNVFGGNPFNPTSIIVWSPT